MLSVFNVIEQVSMKIPPNLNPKQLDALPWDQTSFRVTASWMAEESDHNREFEATCRIRLPDGSEHGPEDPLRFQFKSDFYRIIYNMSGGGLFGRQNGIAWIESHVRDRESGNSKMQRYPIVVRVTEPEEQA